MCNTTFPENVQGILDSFDENQDSYSECERIVTKLKSIGWEADYDLDGILINIKKSDK